MFKELSALQQAGKRFGVWKVRFFLYFLPSLITLSPMQDKISETMTQLLGRLSMWVDATLSNQYTLIEISWIGLSIALSVLILGPFFKGMLERSTANFKKTSLTAAFLNSLRRVVMPASLLALLAVGYFGAVFAAVKPDFLGVFLSLSLALLVIRYLSQFIKNDFLRRTFVLVTLLVAGLDIVDLLTPVTEILSDLSFSLGSFKLSVWTLLKALVALLALVWASNAISNIFDRTIKRSQSFTPSAKALMSKAFRIALMTLVVIVTLNSVGVDLTTLAVFSGAIGVGIGFGLQKIFSNLIAGFILLMDKSIKPGDVIEVGDTFGWVTSVGGRYVSVVTRSQTEHLIPNEMLITEPVINWSFSNSTLRLKLPIGVHYDADVERAMKLCVEAASKHARVLKDPHPRCWITEFGDNSVNFNLLIWIADPREGVSNIKGQVYLDVWRLFKEHGIEIPYPQRDLHIRSVADDVTFKAK